MNDLVKVNNEGKVTVTSKELAEKFGKSHRNVTRDIENLECSQEFRELNFERSSYISKQNKKLECYNITRDGFVFLAMGFTGKEAAQWKEKYINAFNEMERELLSASKVESSSVMSCLNEAIKIMESDKAIASTCGKALSEWKKTKKSHEEKVKKMMDEAQLLLGF